MNGNFKLVLGSALWIVSSAVLAQSAVSDLRQAVNIAVEENPEVSAAYYEFDAASEGERAARGGYLPRVDLNGSIGRERSESPLKAESYYTESQANISATQLLFDGFKTSSAVRQAEHEALSAYFHLKDRSELVALDAAAAYLDTVRYQQLYMLADQNYQTHRRVLGDIDERVEAGVSRRVDLEQANARLSLAESNLRTEASNLYDTILRFQRVVGLLPAADLAPVMLSDAGLPANRQVAVDNAKSGNPALSRALQDIKAAEAFESQARAPNYPEFYLRLRQSIADDTDGILGNYNETAIELLMNYNLYNGGSDSATLRRAVSLVSVSEYRLEQECRNVNQQLLIAYNDVQTLTQQVETISRNVESISRARQAYYDQFDIGQRTLLDLLDTENEYFEVSRSLVNAKQDLEIAKARTLALMGRLMESLNLGGRVGQATGEVDLSQHSTAELSRFCNIALPAEIEIDFAQQIEEMESVPVYGINFAFDSAEILSNSEPVLNDVLALLQNEPALNLTIEGHTDSIGSNDYNLDLSQRRAQSVVNWLIGKGIAASRLSAMGYGEERPIASNDTVAGRAENRRVALSKR